MDRMAPPRSMLSGDPLDLALKRELRSGERVMWKGRQLARISSKAFGIYLFAIPWTGFALFWTMMAGWGASEMQQETGFLSWAFPLFGVPFVLVGLGMLSTPFLPLLQKNKVLYVVTNERLVRIQTGRKSDVKSVPARQLGMVERSEARDGKGSLKIAINIRTDNDGDRTTEYFELGEVEDVLGAHNHIAAMSRAAVERLSP